MMHPEYSKGFTPISELLNPGTTSTSIVIGGRLYGSRVLCEAWMTFLSAAEFF